MARQRFRSWMAAAMCLGGGLMAPVHGSAQPQTNPQANPQANLQANPHAQQLSSAKPITVTVETDIYHYAQTLLGNDDIMSFHAFDRAYCQRDVVEFILVQKALKLGGANLTFRFATGNYDARNVRLVVDGFLLLSFDTVFLSQANALADSVYISSPMIRSSEYQAGIFVSEANLHKFKVRSAEDLQALSFVSSRDWPQDWQLLTALKPKQLIHEEDWISMAKMVSRGWVDAMLVPFTKTPPYQYQGNGYKIVALPNVKLALHDSRHFMVSKKHPLGAQVFAALQRGLAMMRERGEIEMAYQQCGFINTAVQDWTLLNPDVAASATPIPHN